MQRFFQVCVGMMGMQPSEFWNSSPVEIYNALDGFREFNGTDQQSRPMDKQELKELMELYPD